MLAIHRLTSDNAVPACVGTDSNGLMVVVDGKFTGGDPANAAVTGKAGLYLRDIDVSGYGHAVKTERRGAQNLPMSGPNTRINFYASERHAVGVEKAEPMRLPIVSTPAFWTDDLNQWTSPQQFLGTPAEKPDDWTDAMQKALDSGKPVVYLPNGSYRISRTLTVPPHVRLIIGMQSSITPGKDNQDTIDPLIRFIGRGGESTTLEHLWISGHVEHAADRAVAFRHVDLHGRYANTDTGTGDVFFEDTIGPKPLRVAHPQRVFARQLNIEFGEKPLIENHGGTLWLLGYKTEGQMVCIEQTAGKTELLGGLLYPLRSVDGGTPAFRIRGGEASLSFVVSGKKYPHAVRSQSRDGEVVLESKSFDSRVAAFIQVNSGPDAIGTGARIEPDIDDSGGGVPFWTGKVADAEGYLDPSGNRWNVLSLGGAADKIADAKSLSWNADTGRWEGASPADQAPSFSRQRILRGRPAGGKLIGLSFQPKAAGTFAMSGTANVDTWGPDGSIVLHVLAITSAGDTRTLLKETVPDNSTIDWTKFADLQKIELQAGEKIVLSFASEKGGTASLDLASQKKPTSIRKQ